jgi:hypothetical protein
VELAVLGGVDNMHEIVDDLTPEASSPYQFVKIYHGVHTLTVNQNLDNFPQLLPSYVYECPSRKGIPPHRRGNKRKLSKILVIRNNQRR